MDLLGQAPSAKLTLANEELVQRLVREQNEAMGSRGVWESHWQEIAERIYPSMSWKFNPNSQTTEGAKKTEHVYDSTAAMSLDRFGAIVDSLITPRNSLYHGLEATDPALNKIRAVREWFEEATRILFHFRYLPQANFASQNQMGYKSYGAFGNDALFIDPMWRAKGIRYRCMSLGEVYFFENHQGIIDKVVRIFQLTVRQAIQKWGDKLPESIRKVAETNPERKFQFSHCVEPREDFDPTRRDFKGMKFASYYYTTEQFTMLEEGGYHVFPYAISRYEQFPDEVYGRSIAMNLLPAIKTLNEEKKTVLKQGQRALDPILLVHDDGVIDGFSMKSGAMNAGAVTADGRPLVHTLPTGNIVVGKELMDDERNIIKDGFFVSIFQILTESPQMTATEVMEKAREKGILLSPTIGRVEAEKQGPQIERELDILMQQGLLPPMPPELLEAKGEYKVVYDSPLSRAQRSGEAAGIMRTLQATLEVVQITQDPSPLDNFNFDEIVPELASINSVPLRWMNDPKTISSIRQARNEQMQLKQMTEAAPGAAAMINAGAKAKMANVGQ
jgi:hypothetical protein